jgi:hypothetical protein
MLEELTYAPDSPLLNEMKKPAIAFVKHQRYGARKIRDRCRMNKSKMFKGRGM